MKIKEIVEDSFVVDKFNINEEKEILGFSDDSRRIEKNYIFFAKKGFHSNGINYAHDAIKNNASCVVSEKNIKNIPLILVNDIHEAEEKILKKFYNDPVNSYCFVGITGTKGKTTSSFLVYDYLQKKNANVCYIGTIGIYDKERNQNRNYYTTPTIYELYSILNKLRNNGHDICILEISSHSLIQERIIGLNFEITAFTNLSHDHLDYHKNMDDYFKAKSMLFFNYQSNLSIINIDDEYGKKLFENINYKKIGFGLKNYTGKIDYKTFENGFKILIDGKEYFLNLPGEFNLYNGILSGLIIKNLGFDINGILLGENGVPGRLEFIEKEGIKIFIDYAHSPDSLEKLLNLLKVKKEKKLISVFGCTGDRDKDKRPLMGKIAERFSDYVIITSDDPHGENPFEICRAVKKGFKNKNKCEIVVNRKEAIVKAVRKSNKNDTVVIAGKGHEKFQIFDGFELYHNDKEVIINYFKDNKEN